MADECSLNHAFVSCVRASELCTKLGFVMSKVVLTCQEDGSGGKGEKVKRLRHLENGATVTCQKYAASHLLMAAICTTTPATRIVLENSGVAEPSAIRDRFNEAESEGHPLLERLYLDTMVTLVRVCMLCMACAVCDEPCERGNKGSWVLAVQCVCACCVWPVQCVMNPRERE